MARRSNSIESLNEDEYVVVEDLSTWEVIDLSEDDIVDLDDFSLSDSESSDSSLPAEFQADDVISELKAVVEPDLGSPPADVFLLSLLGEPHPPNLQNKGVGEYCGGDDHRDPDELAKVSRHVDQGVSEIDENYDDDYYYEHGYADEYDDELVPLNVRNRFGRQRIRKLGKRVCPKMNKSKKLPYKYNRPGCLHGKHGLGVQFSYI